MQVILY